MEKVVYKVGKFIDFAKQEREVVLVAVSCDSNGVCFDSESKNYDDIPREIRLGISVQSPSDKVTNTDLGKVIAYGKAKKDKSCIGKLYSTQKGFINQKVVEALLEQEFDYFRNSPQAYLKGYYKDMELFKNNPEAYYSKFNLK